MARDPLNILTDTRKWQTTGVIVSFFIHSLFFLWALIYVGKAAERVVTHIRFVSPPPITKKSFELAKRPEISEVQMQMLLSMPQEEAPVIDVSAVVDVGTFGADLLSVVSPVTGVAGGGSGGKVMGMIAGSISGARPVQMGFQPVGAIQLTQVAKPVQQALSLRTELLNVRNLDTGRYRATIIIDPKDKRNIKGFFKMTIIRYNYMDFNADRFPTAVDELMRYIRDHTKINAQIEGTMIELSDAKLFEAPFIYMTGSQAVVSLSPVEIENLGNYLRNGGFLFAEDIVHSTTTGETPTGAQVGTPFDRQFKDLIKKALGSDAKWFKIPKNHPLFYGFYDFPSGPPIGAQNGNVFDMEGIELRGRLAVVFSDLNISWFWSSEAGQSGKERGLQFGVNLIVYALTQPGGIANVSQYTE